MAQRIQAVIKATQQQRQDTLKQADQQTLVKPDGQWPTQRAPQKAGLHAASDKGVTSLTGGSDANARTLESQRHESGQMQSSDVSTQRGLNKSARPSKARQRQHTRSHLRVQVDAEEVSARTP